MAERIQQIDGRVERPFPAAIGRPLSCLGERREIDRESIDLVASGTLQKMPTLGVLIPSLRS
jgi:hypothetical protein